MSYTERFTRYAKSRGMRPEDLPESSRTNADYINWIGERWSEFRRAHPEYRNVESWHYHFDAWLAERVP